jgi:hypothetical protein
MSASTDADEFLSRLPESCHIGVCQKNESGLAISVRGHEGAVAAIW